MKKILEQLEAIGLLPVIKIEECEDALPLAKALVDGGIDAAEITYRTACATEAIAAIHAAYPEMLLGAGTIRSVEQAQEAIQAGASFLITPGFNEDVVAWCKDHDVCIIPGVSSASEIEQAQRYHITTLKFFPAESSGGAKKLKDFAAPYPDITFIPTGGIDEQNLHDYLQLPNVLAIGGSFMIKADAMKQKQWDVIRNTCEQAITTMLSYELMHIGIHATTSETAKQHATLLCSLFHFPYYEKPKSHFAGRGFEIVNKLGNDEHGHFAIYTPYPLRAMYQLAKKGIHFDESSITRNKQTNRINFVYLKESIAGFGMHLINPDVKM